MAAFGSSLAGKVFAVTGGASGMGLAVCHRLAALKAKAICIADFNTANFETVTEALKKTGESTEILTTKVDVSSSASVNEWFDEVIKKYNQLDGVVNCAGLAQAVGARKAPNILEETDETWNKVMGVNLNGVFFCIRAAAKHMIALPKAPRSIVNISSLAGWLHSPDVYAYGTSKRAVVGLTPAISKDLGPFGIRVNTILPAPTETPMIKQFFKVPEGEETPTSFKGMKMVQPDDMARVIIYLLSDESDLVSGVCIPVGATMT